MSGAVVFLLVTALFWPGEPSGLATVPRRPVNPAAVSPAMTPRHFVVQMRILEVDGEGLQTVIATPVIQTTGTAAGVLVEADNGRRFEVHFSAADADSLAKVPDSRESLRGAGTPLTPVIATQTQTQTQNTMANPLAAALAPPAASAERSREPRVTVKAVQQPATVVLRDVARQAGLMIVVEREAAETVTTRLAAPVNLELNDAPLDQALDQLVTPLALEYAVRNDLMLIGFRTPTQRLGEELPSVQPTTTLTPASSGASSTSPPVPSIAGAMTATTGSSAPPAALAAPQPATVSTPATSPQSAPTSPLSDSDWQLRVYGVAELLEAGTAGEPLNFQPLIGQVVRDVAPRTWAEVGGEATIRGFDSTRSLVVRQSSAGHAALADYLSQLRRKNSIRQP